jgi:hypothetical protein
MRMIGFRVRDDGRGVKGLENADDVGVQLFADVISDELTAVFR